MERRGVQRTGRWEARVRMSRACACYQPVLLLWPTKGGGGVASAGGGGEVDYMEVVDTGRHDGAEFFLHYGPEDEDRELHTHVTADLTRWHTFAVEWTAEGLTGYIDGRPWFHTLQRSALPTGEMGQTIQLDWFPEDRGRTAGDVDPDAEAVLEVDWIRMYRVLTHPIRIRHHRESNFAGSPVACSCRGSGRTRNRSGRPSGCGRRCGASAG
jgi:hypothetical protein